MSRQNVVDMHRHTGATVSCPSSEELANHFISDHAAVAHGGPIADHLLRCGDCREVLRAIEPFRDFRQEIALGVGLYYEGRRRRRTLAIAASVLVLAGASLLLTDLSFDRGPATSSAVGDLTRSAQPQRTVTSPGHQSLLAAAPERIQFENAVGAQVTIELFDERLLPVWKSPAVTSQGVTLPGSVREAMRPGTTFLWQIHRTEGVTSTTSPLYSFSIQGQDVGVNRRDPTRRQRSRRDEG